MTEPSPLISGNWVAAEALLEIWMVSPVTRLMRKTSSLPSAFWPVGLMRAVKVKYWPSADMRGLKTGVLAGLEVIWR